MKKLLFIPLLITSLYSNKFQDASSVNLDLAKTSLKYQAFNRFSIMQYTKALKRLFFDKKHEWKILEDIRNGEN